MALCYISHIGGGEHPPNVTVLASPAPAWEGRRGADTAVVRSGTSVARSPTKNTGPGWFVDESS